MNDGPKLLSTNLIRHVKLLGRIFVLDFNKTNFLKMTFLIDQKKDDILKFSLEDLILS